MPASSATSPTTPTASPFPAYEAQPTTLPFVLEGNRISLVFGTDAMAGVRLTALQHHEGDATFDFRFLPQAIAANGIQQWNLWEIACTLANGQEVTLRPRTRRGFTAMQGTTTSGDPCAVFRWSRLRIPRTPLANRVDVEVVVSLAPDDRLSRW
jgi:hypothetical protein